MRNKPSEKSNPITLLDVFQFLYNASVNQRRAIALCLANNKNRIGKPGVSYPKYTLEWWENNFNQRLGGIA